MASNDFKDVATKLIRDHAVHITPFHLAEVLARSNDLIERIVIREGEITPDLEAEILELQLHTEDSVDYHCFQLAQLDAQAQFFKEKADKILKVSRGLENYRERIKNRIKDLMLASSVRELKGREQTLQLTKTKDRILVDEAKLPQQYWSERTEYFYEKEELRKMIESVKIPGVHCEQSFALRIKESRPQLK